MAGVKVLRAWLLLVPCSALRLPAAEVNRSELVDLIKVARSWLDAPVRGTSDRENPKCDQACTNGDAKARQQCNVDCANLQTKICGPTFIGCHKSCGNHEHATAQDVECETLCNHATEKVCYPLKYEAPANVVSPHHNDQVPPSIEATPPPRIFAGDFPICNLYPADYDFEVLQLSDFGATDGPVLTTLGYKQCDRIRMSSFQSVGLRARGQLAGVSRKILKIPSVMVFGQWSQSNNQIEFNRYFAKGNGPMVCNGFPMWRTPQKAEPVQIFRGGYEGTALSQLRYKECMPTGMQNGEVLAVQITGKDAGIYKVSGSPSAIVLGKAGHTTGLAIEAWTDNEVGL